MLLSLTLFLTVSYHASPYYTGADIVFLFAWLPLVLAGSGGVLSLDALIAARARRAAGLGSPEVVAVPFTVIQQVCGQFEADTCRARRGAPCQAAPCPFLRRNGQLDGRSPKTGGLVDEKRSRPDEVDRRTLVLGGVAVAAVGVAGLATAGLAAGIGRAVGGAPPPGGGTVSLPAPGAVSPTTTTSPPTTAPGASTGPSTSTTAAPSKPAGTAIGAAREVPVGGAARFTQPGTGDPSLVLQLTPGQFVAYDAICPHAGCTVGYSAAAKLLVCPCHGSEFNPANGDVSGRPGDEGPRHHRRQGGSRRAPLRDLRSWWPEIPVACRSRVTWILMTWDPGDLRSR